MRPASCRSQGSFVLAGLLARAPPLAAEDPAGVRCELQEGSFLVPECSNCEIDASPAPLVGTFLLTHGQPGVGRTPWLLTELDLRCDPAPPAPGPERCGQSPTPSVGCAVYPPCAP